MARDSLGTPFPGLQPASVVSNFHLCMREPGNKAILVTRVDTHQHESCTLQGTMHTYCENVEFFLVSSKVPLHRLWVLVKHWLGRGRLVLIFFLHEYEKEGEYTLTVSSGPH